jgi:acyl carrier protein
VRNELIALTVKTLQEIDGHYARKIPRDVGSETPLFGQEGILDSVGLVTLIVAVEQAIEDTFGVSVSLADEKAMSQRHSPYRTIGTLAEYAQHMIQGEI